MEIHWQSGDTKFWITFDEPLYIPYALEHPFLKHFLNKYQASDAIAWFDELITSEERSLELSN